MDDKAYRRALGAFATGVAVVTAADGAGVRAITINSLTSVSLAPRLILWCLGDQSERFDAFAQAEAFGITILDAGQADLAARFAVQNCQALEPGEHATLAGAPVLSAGLSRLACRAHERRTMGDHLVIVGEVVAFDNADGAGLTYFRGRFGEAAP